MKTTATVSFLLLACACAGPRPLERVEVPPPVPRGGELAPNAPASTDESATERWLQSEIDRQRGSSGAGGVVPAPQEPQQPRPAGQSETNEEATRAWLDRTIEERRAANPDVPPEPIYQTVERTVYVDRPVSRYDERYGVGYDDYGQPVYTQGYDQRRSHYETPFPVNTVVGAGIGAVIGHQSHHRDQGAAIGAGVGLLLDLARWSR